LNRYVLQRIFVPVLPEVLSLSIREQSQAQIEAFEDTWHWTEEAEKAFDHVMASGNTDAAEMLRAMRSFLAWG
jgi:hypothetical protein